MASIHQVNEEYIRACLVQSTEAPASGEAEFPSFFSLSNDPPCPAAVLVPLVQVPGPNTHPSWHLLFTRRTDLVHDHKGQVSFPGGRSDSGDITPENTALREAFEEIGLRSSDVRILGRLPHFVTITNYLVTPIVGTFSWPYPFDVQQAEVSRVFTIPLEWMANPAHFQVRQRELPPDFPTPSQFRRVNVVYFDQYDGEILWGASAKVTLDLLEKLRLLNVTGAGL